MDFALPGRLLAGSGGTPSEGSASVEGGSCTPPKGTSLGLVLVPTRCPDPLDDEDPLPRMGGTPNGWASCELLDVPDDNSLDCS